MTRFKSSLQWLHNFHSVQTIHFPSWVALIDWRKKRQHYTYWSPLLSFSLSLSPYREMKEAFQVKLRELKEKAEELGPGTEEELSAEESEEASEATFTDELITDGPFTDEFAPTISITTEPEELPSTPDVTTDQLEPTEMLSTPTTEVLPTEYPDEEWNQEVVNDEAQTGEESEEEEGEDEVPVAGAVEEEDDDDEEEEEGDEEEAPVSEEESSRINILSRLMSERRNQKMKHWMKRGKAMKSKLKSVMKNWFNKRRGDKN